METKIIPVQAGVGAAYLVVAEDRFFLVDTGSPGKEKKILKAITSRGLKPESLSFIFLTHTHYDHAGSAAFLKEATGAKIIVQASEADKLATGYSGTPDGTNPLFKGISYLGKRFKSPLNMYEPVNPDVVFEEKLDLKEYGINGYIIHTPGHTSGSSSLILRTKAIVGDTMFHWGKFIYPPFANDEATLIKSWEKLLDMEVDTFYPAHGKPLRKDVVLKVYEKMKRKK